MEQDAKNNET